MSLAYSPQTAQLLSSSRSMSMTSVHVRALPPARLRGPGEESIIGEPEPGKETEWDSKNGRQWMTAAVL